MTELLAPAGNIESLDAAIGEGADAVYLGLKSFNARLRSSNFTWNQFEASVNSLHRQGKKIYVAVNTVVEERETERLYRFLLYLDNVQPDGLIVQDLAIARMAQEFFPDLVLHASTQMNIASAAAVNALSKSGFKRVVLAREMCRSEINKIRAQTNMELEVFVHGALCISESGLCLFSSFLGGKSANRGLCTQACRRSYTANLPGGIKRGYYFSPYDLQLIDDVPDLMDIGIESLKIEGRMKSAEYVGSVVAAYRYVIDHCKEDKKGAITAAKRMLATDFARSKTKYWYGFDDETAATENAGDVALNPEQAGGTGIYLGVIERIKKSADTDNSKAEMQMAFITGGSYTPDTGDSIRLHKKDDTGRLSHKIRNVEFDKEGRQWIDIPQGFSEGDSVYLLQIKSMSKHYARVLPHDTSMFRRQPGIERLPVLDITPVKKNELSYFPEGLYVQVSTVKDAFIVQSAYPVRVIIELNSETAPNLLSNKQVLSLSKKQIVLSLDPFCPSSAEDKTRDIIKALVKAGYKTWIANNIAHIPMLHSEKAAIIAGPYLYTFNRWAVSWFENQDIGAFISPFENSKRNIEATYDTDVRSRLMITLFAYPALFRIRCKLPASYDFTYFSDKEGTEFKVNSTPDGSFAMPESPFSIIDKAKLLREKGFSRFLIDFSKTKVSKSSFKQIVSAFLKGEVLQGSFRFNWKDGFYSVEQNKSAASIKKTPNQA